MKGTKVAVFFLNRNIETVSKNTDKKLEENTQHANKTSIRTMILEKPRSAVVELRTAFVLIQPHRKLTMKTIEVMDLPAARAAENKHFYIHQNLGWLCVFYMHCPSFALAFSMILCRYINLC